MDPESIQAWESFARERGFRFTPPSAYPNVELSIEGARDGIDVTITTRHGKEDSVETRIHASARHAMVGRVEIRERRWTDWLVGFFRGRTAIGDGELDAELSAFTSSAALLRAVLDDRTLPALRSLRDKPRFSFVYEHGTVAIRWAGIERGVEPLDAAMGLAAYLAVVGSEVSPYR